MSFFLNPYRFGGQDLIVGFGDSQMAADAASGAYGPTPTAGTVKAWNPATSTIVDVGATDTPGSASNSGSFWPQFGIDHYNTTGRIPIVYNGGVANSNWANPGDSNFWGPSSTNYTTWRTNVQNALVASGLSNPSLILISLGMYDIMDGVALATIDTAIGAMLNQVISDFPGVKIGIIFPGHTSSGTSNVRNHTIRQYLINYCNSLTDVWPILQVAPFRSAGYYAGDDNHVLQAGRNIMGDMINRWLNLNSGVTDKWARGTISTHFDELSTARKTLIENWFASMGSNWTELDVFYNFRTTIVENTNIDFRWKYSGGGNTSFTANSGIGTTVTTNYRDSNVVMADRLEGTTTDYYIGTKVIVNSSDNSAQRMLHGLGNVAVTSQNFVSQISTGIRVRCFDVASTDYTGDSGILNDTFYANYRNGTTKGLWKNSASVNSATVSSAGAISAITYYIGSMNVNVVSTSGITATLAYNMAGQFSTSNLATIYAACEAMIDGW